MGQYYTPILIKGNVKKAFRCYDYNNGAKLMEHSYIGNNFVETIVKFMLEDGNIYRLAWVGDYADDYVEREKMPNPHYYSDSKYKNLYQRFINYEKNENKKYFKPECIGKMENSMQLVFINHTKKEYVDMCHYVDDNHSSPCWGMRVHPLPLLTAIGNGYGGGDYHKQSEFVGYWAGDEIQVENYLEDKYKEYREIRPIFYDE